MSNAFADIQTVYKTNYDYPRLISVMQVVKRNYNYVTIIKYTEMQKYEMTQYTRS